MQLIEEEHDVLRLPDLLHHGLEALFELPAVLGARHERAEIELEQPLLGEHIRDLMAHDALGQPLDDGRLADTGLPDQHRVVLRAAGEDLNHPLDLGLAPDHGIELALAGELRQITREFVEDGGLGPLLGPGIVLVAKQGQRLLAHLVQPRAEGLEDLGGDRLPFLHEAEQQMLGADVVVAELARLLDAELENTLGLGRERHLTERQCLGESGQGPLDFRLDGFELEPEPLEHRGRDALPVPDQPEQDMLGSDEVVAETARLFPGQDDDPARPLSESFEHWVTSLPCIGNRLVFLDLYLL